MTAIQIYSLRHKLEPEKVARFPMVELAAYLEYSVGLQQISLAEARRRLVEQYPETNNVTGIVYREDKAGRIFKHRIPSALELITAYKDMVFDPIFV
jgi:hypothetical protein